MMLRNAFNELVEVLHEAPNLSRSAKGSVREDKSAYILATEVEALRPGEVERRIAPADRK